MIALTGEYTDAEKESACTKLWNVYVGEAERYDRGLIESWKGDMNGMLIFVRCGVTVASCCL